MREEFRKYRDQIVSQIALEEKHGSDPNTGSGVHAPTAHMGTYAQPNKGKKEVKRTRSDGDEEDDSDSGDYDTLYDTLAAVKMLPPAPEPPLMQVSFRYQ